MKFPAGERKKKRNFGPPTLRAPTTRPAHHPTKNQKLAKCGLAKFGQQKLAKFGQIRLAKCGKLTLAKCGIGQIRFGQMRPNKDGQIRFGQIRPRPTGPTSAGLPKISLFFPSPATISLFLCLSGCLPLSGVFEGQNPNVHVWALGLSLEPRRLRKKGTSGRFGQSRPPQFWPKWVN